MPTPLSIPKGTVYTFLGERLPDVEAMIFTPVADTRPPQLMQPRSFVSFRFWQTEISPKLWPGLDVVFQYVLPKGTVPANPWPPSASLPQTVVEATALVSYRLGPDGDELVSRTFDDCLGKLRTLLTAYAVSTHHAMPAITRERLPFLIPWISRSPTADEWDPHLSMMHLHLNVAVPPTEHLGADDFTRLNSILSRVVRGDVLTAYSLHRMRAARAFCLEGDYSEAVLYCQIAIEVFLDAVLYLLLWEQGADPASSAASVPTQLRSRIGLSLAPRLGGSWSLGGGGAIAAWWKELRPLRNRVVHAAYVASVDEGERALKITQTVDTFLRRRLAERAPKFPKTALLVLGVPGLERHKRWSKRLSAVVDMSASEDDWVKAAAAWRAAFDAARLDLS